MSSFLFFSSQVKLVKFIGYFVFQGAGDAFVGALATYLVTHKDYPMHQIIGAACKIATISVTREGTQTSYPTNYNAFNQQYKYERL